MEYFQGISIVLLQVLHPRDQERLEVGIFWSNQMRTLQSPLLSDSYSNQGFAIYMYFISEAIMYEWGYTS